MNELWEDNERIPEPFWHIHCSGRSVEMDYEPEERLEIVDPLFGTDFSPLLLFFKWGFRPHFWENWDEDALEILKPWR